MSCADPLYPMASVEFIDGMFTPSLDEAVDDATVDRLFSEEPRFPFDNEASDLESRLDRLAEEHPDIAEPLKSWREDTKKGNTKKKRTEEEGCSKDKEGGSEKSKSGLGGGERLRNTVPDMQQRRDQEEEERLAGRSQSAPPTQQSGEMGGQPQQPAREPVVRHIPIYVEGRDEPVIPRDFTDSSFPREKRNLSRESSPVPPARRSTQEHPRPNQTKQQHTSSVHINQERPVEIKIETPHQEPPQTQPQAPPPQQQVPPQPQQIPKKPTGPLDPLQRVEQVQEDVASLVKDVESFEGGRQDKRYIYLDEMLTRNLLKLDDIETEGREDVRTARKEAIRVIQRSISLLENKASPQTKREETSQPKVETESSTTEQKLLENTPSTETTTSGNTEQSNPPKPS